MESGEKIGRSLASVTDGKIIAVGEMGDGFYSKRTEGDGFAVLPFGGFVSKCLRLFSGARKINLFAPADGVVTEISPDNITLRTGDGVTVSVVFGEGALLYTDVGSMLKRGERFCSIPRDRNAVPVLFPKPNQITELHVLSGFHRSGESAAEYKPVPDMNCD